MTIRAGSDRIDSLGARCIRVKTACGAIVSPEQENLPGAGLKPCYQTLRTAHHIKKMITVTRTPPMTRRKRSGHHGHQSDALAFTQLSSAAPLRGKALENWREAVRAGMRPLLMLIARGAAGGVAASLVGTGALYRVLQ
jgi:hypothetical protein